MRLDVCPHTRAVTNRKFLTQFANHNTISKIFTFEYSFLRVWEYTFLFFLVFKNKKPRDWFGVCTQYRQYDDCWLLDLWCRLLYPQTRQFYNSICISYSRNHWASNSTTTTTSAAAASMTAVAVAVVVAVAVLVLASSVYMMHTTVKNHIVWLLLWLGWDNK